MSDPDPRVLSIKATALCQAIRPMLAGNGPDVQSVVLADLLATYLAGWPESEREEVLVLMLGLVRDLIPVNEKIMTAELMKRARRLKDRKTKGSGT